MKLCIPSLGALIRLNKDWQFKLFLEKRNATVLAAVLDGAKKVDVPGTWSYYYYVHPDPSSSSHCHYVKEWTELIDKFKDAGFLVMKEPEPEGDSYKSYRDQDRLPYITAELPKGTMLAFDRYYIRQGAEAFDSVTFKIESCPDPKFAKNKNTARRFWARLQDVNNIECELVG